MSKPTISKLRIHPIKSLSHVEVTEVEIGMHAIAEDRRYAMIDVDGRYVNGKRTGQVNQLITNYDLDNRTVSFEAQESINVTTFALREHNNLLDEYLSDYFKIKLRLHEDLQGKFQDIPMESSITIVSEASLKYLQNDVDRHDLESIRQRFRSNIEITNVPAFWEECLYEEPGKGMRFRLGEVEMLGISPRARCNVPPQNPETGEMDYHFVKDMINSRNGHTSSEKLLPFGKSTYFMAINIHVPKTEEGKTLMLNDSIELLETVKFS